MTDFVVRLLKNNKNIVCLAEFTRATMKLMVLAQQIYFRLGMEVNSAWIKGMSWSLVIPG